MERPSLAEAVIPGISYGTAAHVRLFNIVANFLSNVTLEPAIFIWTLGWSIQSVIISQLQYEKVCKLGSDWFGNGTSFDDDVCDALDNGEHDEEQEMVQKAVANLHLTMSLVQAVPVIFFSMFMGAWSDRFGRKVIIVSGIRLYFRYLSTRRMLSFPFDRSFRSWGTSWRTRP